MSIVIYLRRQQQRQQKLFRVHDFVWTYGLIFWPNYSFNVPICVFTIYNLAGIERFGDQRLCFFFYILFSFRTPHFSGVQCVDSCSIQSIVNADVCVACPCPFYIRLIWCVWRYNYIFCFVNWSDFHTHKQFDKLMTLRLCAQRCVCKVCSRIIYIL